MQLPERGKLVQLIAEGLLPPLSPDVESAQKIVMSAPTVAFEACLSVVVT